MSTVKKMILSELKLGDEVEYLWVNRWERFVVTAIKTTLDKSGLKTCATLHSAKLAHEAYVGVEHVNRDQLRWPPSPEQAAAALKERLAKLETGVAALLVEIGAIRREVSPERAR